MKSLTIAILSVLTLLTGVVDALAEKHTAAVMPLERGAGGAEYEGFGRALADMMVTDFSRAEVLQLVERTQLKLILDELKLAKTGYLNKKTAQRLGRGLGAEFVITGTFTVVDETFVMNCRIFEVESGAILKSAQSTGEVADFVAVEKDVVEKLLVGLKVKLSLATRRKLLIDAPTENAIALASYGRGLDAQEAGKIAEAQKAFALAVSKDPNFGKAGDALRGLAGQVKVEVAREEDLARSEREKPMLAALRLLPSEMKRGAKFRDTADSLLDFAIRQRLLRNTEQYCQQYQELKHILIRRKGEFADGVAPLIPNPKARRNFGEREARKRMRDRRKVLSVNKGDTSYARSSDRNFSTDSLQIVSSARRMFVGGGGEVERYAELLGSMELCFSGKQLSNEFDSLIRVIRRFSFWQEGPVNPDELALRDALLLHGAFLQAGSRGVDTKLHRQIEKILASYPSGHPGRADSLTRAEEVVDAGEKQVVRTALRGTMRRPEILRLSFAIARQKNGMFHQGGYCQSFLNRSRKDFEYAIGHYLGEYGKRSLGFIPRRIDGMAKHLYPLVYAGCVKSRSKRPLTLSEIHSRVKKRATRTNPDKKIPENCPIYVRSLLNQTIPNANNHYSEEKKMYSLLVSLQQTYQNRCLLRP